MKFLNPDLLKELETYEITFPRVLEIVEQELIANTDYLAFQSLMLKFIFICERELYLPTDGEIRDLFRAYYAKTSQEFLAIHGCLKVGSLYGVLHHLRSLVEIKALMNYVFASDNKTKQKKRLLKFKEYPHLARYQRHRTERKRVETGVLTEEEFEKTRIIKPDDVASFTPERLTSWKRLWDSEHDDLLKISHWHHRANLDNLIKSSLNGNSEIYGFVCHGVHFSPMGGGLVSPSELIMQPKSVWRAQEFIEFAVLMIVKMFETVDSWLKADLIRQFEPEFKQFRLFHKMADAN